MDTKMMAKTAVRTFSSTVTKIQFSEWDASTPASQWNVRELVNHVTSEALWIPDILLGRTIADVGDKYDGDVLGEDPKSSWEQAAILAEEAISKLDNVEMVVHLSFGDTAAKTYLEQMTIEHAIHSWDLACAIGAEIQLDEDLVKAVWPIFQRQAEDWRKFGVIGKAVQIQAGASLQDKLIALSGRQP